MFDSLTKFITGSSKDSLIASALKPQLEKQLLGVATVQSLEIDSKAKSAKIALSLEGESRPVEIVVARYELENVGGQTRLRVREWSCASHPWIDKLGNRFKPEIDLDFKVPYALASTVLG